jgi:hypothetical protein
MLQVACRRESCCSIQPSSYREPSTAAPSPAYRLSADRVREQEAIFSHNILLRPQSRLVWLAVRAHHQEPLVRAGACSATARAKSASFRWPGRLFAISLALPPSLSAPTLSCSLPFSHLVFCLLPPSLRGSANTRPHTQTWKCILLMRNYSHHWTL